MTQLTPNFSLAELTRSDLARELGVLNTPNAKELERLSSHLAAGLESARAILGNRRMVITSGFRSERVNRAAGGVPTSAHRLGYAADFHVPGVATLSAAVMLSKSKLTFDQLIWEKGRGVIHLSFDPRSRREVLTQPGPAGSKFLTGLIS